MKKSRSIQDTQMATRRDRRFQRLYLLFLEKCVGKHSAPVIIALVLWPEHRRDDCDPGLETRAGMDGPTFEVRGRWLQMGRAR